MKLIENSPLEVQKAMSTILDCFTGADGGGEFLCLCALINAISANLNVEGQKDSSKEILDTIIHFSRLIEIASKK